MNKEVNAGDYDWLDLSRDTRFDYFWENFDNATKQNPYPDHDSYYDKNRNIIMHKKPKAKQFTEYQLSQSTEPTERAIDKQIGGSHYKDAAIQPYEFCQKNNLNYLESNVIKYVFRHGNKGGAQDIDKAIHTLQVLKEMTYPES